MKLSNQFHPSALLLGSLLAFAAGARAELLHYYVGVDGLQTLATGTYAGQANPNFGRLTFLYAHTYPTTPASNHYHSKAVFTYTGPASNPTITNSASNYVPEGALPPLSLFAGSGPYAGRLTSGTYADSTDPNHSFSQLTLGQTGALAGFAPGSGEHFLHNASSGRWNGALTEADLHLELVSLSPGLNVGSSASMNLLSVPGDDLHLGEGDEFFAFTPVFWTEADAAPGVYEAAFRLTDEAGAFGESGVFRYRFDVVPEPGTMALLVLAGLLVVCFRHRLGRPARG